MTSEGADIRRERDVRPTVAMPRRGVSNGVLVGGALFAGILLFTALEARREAKTAPAVVARPADVVGSDTPPPLYVPPVPEPVQLPTIPLPQAERIVPIEPRVPPRPSYVPPQITVAPSVSIAERPIQQPPRATGGASIVVDNSEPRGGATSGSAETAASTPESGGSAPRAKAGAIANRSTTVPQGTLIPAVLETAFNSTRAGFARALVQRDVYGFDGRRVLIPRGSRLIGEYRSDVAQGQNRALINWTRLIRTDGATIAVGSPVTDSIGAGGVRAKVDSHFLARFGGAILQSVLDVGVNLASRSSGSPVIVALPGAVQQQTSSVTQQANIPPTLKIKQGTSVSVFVARDLDFTDVEARQ